MGPARSPAAAPLTGAGLLLPCVAAATQGLLFVNHAPLIPLILHDLGITPAEAGLLSTVSFAVGGLAGVPTGTLIDRVGPRPVMALSLLSLAISSLASAAAPTYALLLLARAVGGFGVTATFIAGGRYVAALADGRHAYLAQGLLGGSIQLGLGLAIFALPALAERTGWRVALALSAVPALFALLAWLRSAAGVPGRAALGVPTAAGSSGLRNPEVWRLALAHTAMFGLIVVLGSWVTTYLLREFDIGLGAAGVLGAAGTLAGVVARPLGGAIITARRVEPRPLIAMALAANTLATLALAVPTRPLAVAIGAMAVIGLASSLGYAAIVTLATRAEPDAAGAALGVIGAMSTVGVVIGAPLTGWLLEVSGSFAAPMFALAVMPAAALAALRRRGGRA